MGGTADAVLRRVARLADGWLPQAAPGPQLAEMLERLHRYVREAGRPVEAVGVEGRLSLDRTPEAQWTTTLQQWRDLGATYVSVNTMGAGLASPRAHIDAIRRFKESVGAVV
jgi:alkanesulfonate monooxygenase SsuD/methylene tetrahydromethanopterin reductase-like flavin-dependent oxidoreductase (luciferase family)